MFSPGRCRRSPAAMIDIEINGTERKDEIGVISRALCVLRDAVRKNNALVGRNPRPRRSRAAPRARGRDPRQGPEILRRSFRECGAARRHDETHGERLARHDLRRAQCGRRLLQAKIASSNAAGDVSSVAVASEQLLASIEEISRQVVQSTTVVKRAVSESIESSSGMARLTEAARRVGDIVSLISRIAAQTNLLALNATIEAARAGEAGRGFAVVAQEVKTLATQTARATQDISGQIADMQAATESSVTAIDTIQTKIGEIEQISAIIASAVQEQGASTQEIARNVPLRRLRHVRDVDLRRGRRQGRGAHQSKRRIHRRLASELDELAAVFWPTCVPSARRCTRRPSAPDFHLTWSAIPAN